MLSIEPNNDPRAQKAGLPKNAEGKIRLFVKRLEAKYPGASASIGVVENSIGVDRRTGKTKEISVAEEAAINEYGDPGQNIPPRPFMQLTIANNQEEWRKQLEQLLKSKTPGPQALEMVAILARDAVKATISSGEGLTPNAPLTVKIKGRNQPLVDMGDLLRSISYELNIGPAAQGGQEK